MPTTITAHVIAEHGAEFDADLTNLGPHFAFVRAASGLEFREAVTLKFNGVSVHGEVAFVCRNPAGAVVVFNASPEATNTIEELMEDAEVVMGADAPPPAPPPQWEDNTAVGEDSEDPTNPGLQPRAVPVHVEERIYETSKTPEEAEVRRAFARTLPPNYETEPLGTEELDNLRRDPPTVDVAESDESTLVPDARARARTVVAEMDTDHGVEGS